MAKVLYAERAFLQLVAKRLLRYEREASSRGEVYHDLSGFSPLQCGVKVKYRFEEKAGGYLPVVLVQNTISFSPGELKEIAAEILDAPVKLRAAVGDDLEYVRETDSTA